MKPCNIRHQSPSGMLAAIILAGSLVVTPALFAEEGHQHHSTAPSVGWQQQLKGQTIVEESIEGRAGISEKLEMQHNRLMRRIEEQAQNDARAHRTSGAFNNMSTMHQYMGQDGSSFLLAVDPQTDLAGVDGAKCPAAVPTKQYDISMINAEITLNRWQDFYPGYMYVLTENVDKVRAEEKRNTAAREKEGFDPGAVSTGLQGDYIQPLVIRANQGDCLKVTLRNAMDYESGSLHVNGGSMVVSATGRAATTTN